MRGRIIIITSIEILLVFLVSCVGINNASKTIAPGAPGAPSVWAYAGKTGIGTSYETYHQNSYSDLGETGKISKVWFSVAEGILTEKQYGLIHESQIKEMQFVLVGKNFVD